MTPSSTQSATNSFTQPGAGSLQSQKRDDLNYQVVTVAAILLVLATLWVF
jgi:hypothetical protein